MVDVKINTEECSFKYRVSGILIKNGKLLMVRMCKNPFYCLPGGHVELGESSCEAMKREFEEETKIDIEIKDMKLVAITENFFESKVNKNMHEVGFYYLLDFRSEIGINESDFTYIEHDKDGDVELEFKWVDISKIGEISFKPEFLKEKLKNGDYSFVHCIIGK